MKKPLILLSVLILVLTLSAGCTDVTPPANSPASTNNESTSPAADTFALDALSAFLDQENFSKETPDVNIYDQAKKYKYNGKSVYDQLSLSCLDFANGSETYGYKEGLGGLGVSYKYGPELKSADAVTMFLAETALEGLVLPAGIDFGDTLPDILEKLHLPFKTFEPDSESSNEMILIKEGPFKLVVVNDTDGASLYFTEESVDTQNNGTVVQTVRSVNLKFDDSYDSKTALLSSVTMRLDQHRDQSGAGDLENANDKEIDQ